VISKCSYLSFYINVSIILRKYSSPAIFHLSFGCFYLLICPCRFSALTFLLELTGNESQSQYVKRPENNHECQPSTFRGIRNLMKTSSRIVPFYVESIVYLVLGQDYDCKAKDDMEVTVRGAMATEGGGEFKEMNECANSQLYKVEN